MNRGLILEINIDEEENKKEAVILLDNYETYIVPLSFLPKNVQLEDFVIINNGKIEIDPSSDDIKDEMLVNLEKHIKNKEGN